MKTFICVLGYNSCCLLHAGFCRCRRHAPPKHQMTFNELHGVISHNLEPFSVCVLQMAGGCCDRCLVSKHPTVTDVRMSRRCTAISERGIHSVTSIRK